MDNYYELFSLDKSLGIDEINEKLHEEKKKQIGRQNAANLDKRQEAERLLAKIMEAENVFKNEASKSEYDKQLLRSNRGKENNNQQSNKSNEGSGNKINPNAKPSRKLYNGIDYDNGNYYKTEYGKYTVISYNDAFQKINETMCKMIDMGPANGQTHQTFYNEFLRIARIANHNWSLIDTNILCDSIYQCFDAFARGNDESVNNIMAQNAFYYADELYKSRCNPFNLDYVFANMRDWLFAESITRPKHYREVVKAFYMVTKGDRSMPKGFYDLSYITKENENAPDIYYLEVSDYYAQIAISLSESGYEVAHLDTYVKSHELYSSFRSIINENASGEKENKKKLIEIFNSALAHPTDYDPKSEMFITIQPYNAGLAYAIGTILKNTRMTKQALKALTFGKDLKGSIDGTVSIASDIVSENSAIKGIILESITGFTIVGVLVYLELNSHVVWGFILALAAPLIITGVSLTEPEDRYLGSSFIQTLYAFVIGFVPLVFMFNRGHFIFLAVSILILAIMVYLAGRHTGSFGVKGLVGCSFYFYIVCVMLWSGHVYSILVIIGIYVAFIAYNWIKS